MNLRLPPALGAFLPRTDEARPSLPRVALPGVADARGGRGVASRRGGRRGVDTRHVTSRRNDGAGGGSRTDAIPARTRRCERAPGNKNISHFIFFYSLSGVEKKKSIPNRAHLASRVVHAPLPRALPRVLGGLRSLAPASASLIASLWPWSSIAGNSTFSIFTRTSPRRPVLRFDMPLPTTRIARPGAATSNAWMIVSSFFTLRYGHRVMPCSRHRCLRTVTHSPS